MVNFFQKITNLKSKIFLNKNESNYIKFNKKNFKKLNINKNDSTDNNTLTISDQNIHLGDIDVHNINNDNISLNLQPDYLDEIEVLE